MRKPQKIKVSTLNERDKAIFHPNFNVNFSSSSKSNQLTWNSIQFIWYLSQVMKSTNKGYISFNWNFVDLLRYDIKWLLIYSVEIGIINSYDIDSYGDKVD